MNTPTPEPIKTYVIAWGMQRNGMTILPGQQPDYVSLVDSDGQQITYLDLYTDNRGAYIHGELPAGYSLLIQGTQTDLLAASARLRGMLAVAVLIIMVIWLGAMLR